MLYYLAVKVVKSYLIFTVEISHHIHSTSVNHLTRFSEKEVWDPQIPLF